MPSSSSECVSLHWPPSADTTTSQAKRSRSFVKNAGSCGLPISSWPSKKHLTLTGSRPVAVSSASSERIGTSMLPLSSEAPRA